MSEGLNRVLRAMADEIDYLKRELLKGRRSTPYGLPGFKHPYIGVIPMKILESQTDPITEVFNVSTAGPLVVTGFFAAWLDTTTGRFRPVSSLPDTAAPPVVGALDFLWEVEIVGPGWHMQNRPVGSPSIFSNYDRPMYLPHEYLLRGNESFQVTATPTAPPKSNGVLYFCILGYKILSTDALGSIGQGQPSVEEIPGLRLPYKAVINLDIVDSSDDEVVGTYRHTATGLFVVQSLSASWRVRTAGSDNGRFRYLNSNEEGAIVTPVGKALNFVWNIDNGGNDLRWQSISVTDGVPGSLLNVPGPLLFTNRERPLYLAGAGQITPASLTTFRATPTESAGAIENGTLQLVLEGYTIVQGEPWAGV